ncbi:conserved protein, unknown function [Plasmodium yoelii]|nr:conserved protein, unknown function [Plasmodium yoelii]CDU20508.1 conserved Plasmodium protein, unknown function [Plasmodium yoelii]VTZ81469.1 conserved protein, unknown function [Plasmodium yoelii]|eukprot:XP_724906.2 conserved protein, unknown function [Plasmodium yoelii]
MAEPEQSHNNTVNTNLNTQYNVRNLASQTEGAEYKIYEHPASRNVIESSSYQMDTPYYNHGEINTHSINLYNKENYINGNSKLILEPNNSFNVSSLQPQGVEHYDYVNEPISYIDNYGNPVEINNKYIISNDNMKYDINSEIEKTRIYPNIIPQLNSSHMLNLNNNISNADINKYNDSNNTNDIYGYLNNNVSNLNYDYIMKNYDGGLYNNHNNNNHNIGNIIPLNSMQNLSNINELYGINQLDGIDDPNSMDNIKSMPFNLQDNINSYNNEKYIPLPIDNFPYIFNKTPMETDEDDKRYSKLRGIYNVGNVGNVGNIGNIGDLKMNSKKTKCIHNHSKNIDQLQAIVCLQKLEEIPVPFLNINDIKYSINVYFNSYDDILQKYQSKFYNCKLNESDNYADCDFQNEIISLPFNNEEFIYLKVIETSAYKTEITGRLQLKVKSLSQEYPLRIPVIGDDGNSKGFLIMNFFVTSSYHYIKNDMLIDRESLPNKTKSTRIRRKNGGFHFFENFTKWCCEITDHHMN